jgi:acyl-coenzyme A synthetase/AMP-(fatty) acid ligase
MIWLPLATLLTTGRSANHPVAVRGAETLCYGHFAATVAGVARRLAMAPTGPVALQAEDSWHFATALLGVLHAGRSVVLPPHHAGAAAAGEAGTTRIDDAWVAATEAAADFSLAALEPARCTVVFFTSGSTGLPKRVSRTLASLQAEVDIFELMWGGRSGDGPVRAMVSHQHLYGLTFKVLWPLSVGRPFAAEIHESWEAALLHLDATTMLVSSPAHLTRLAGLPALPPERRLARLFSAGAPLPFAASQDAEALLGVAPTEIFGSTETGAIATRTQAHVETLWRLLPGVAMRDDPDGRLTLRSPAIASEDWYRTDDLVEAAGDGFHFRGRADRMVKIEGKRVDLVGLERALEASAWAEAAAVLVLNAPHSGLAAAVVLTGSGRRKLAELGPFRFGRLLRATLATTFGPAGLPRWWRFVERLPDAHMGKRDAAELQTLFLAPP